ncbi:hypothetical protein EXM22_15665 [Oceanispirochaeta crateris]|uniref:Uncharacterized protein n=1 Tax=Oceanispirochaeta crateris TaxID=2518645 RepID=A0A5C1QMR0_9SPIO|nr:DnaB-like helicase C-terminal domain-containing protein [Oceanispirochaeta crateris]QEN09343.1 hypothetical protein EXM22_15665 [Oceanispirochaeta crateris]
MVKKELTEKSPLRSLEKAVNGGLGKGNIAVIASKQGIGKTACLVHIATDKLMRNKHVIHVSYANKVDHIVNWYEDIFTEISKKRSLEGAMDVHNDIIHNRVIMNFSQKGIPVSQVLASVKAMMDNGQVGTDAIIIDGFDFTIGTAEDIKKFKDFALEEQIELWFSDSYKGEENFQDERGIPKNLVKALDDISVVLTLRAEQNYMVLKLVKDHKSIVSEDLQLKLDPKTLLIAEV